MMRPFSALVALALLAAADLAAQSEPRLAGAVRLAREGQADSARAVVKKLLGTLPVADTLYPQALLAESYVTADAAQKEKSLRRIVIEYPSSAWVGEALLRLAEIDYAGGDVTASADKLERLKKDFPESALLPSASLLAARSYFELRNAKRACSWLDAGKAKAGTDVETANQIAFYQQRCAPGALMNDAPTMDTVRLAKGDSVAVPKSGARDSARPAAPKPAPGKPVAKADTVPARPAPKTDSLAARPTPAAPPTPAPAPAPITADTGAVRTPAPAVGPWRLQLAAMKTDAQAKEQVAKLAAKGINADITVEGGYYKVRTGSYGTRAAANAAAATLAPRVGSTPFVVRTGS